MKKIHAIVIVAAAALLAGGPRFSAADMRHSFTADLQGIGGSQAKGQATFTLSEDGKTLHYTLTVADIENASMSHIHLAPAGQDGPVAAWLYPPGPPPAVKDGKFSGTLAEGEITAASLKGPLEGKPLSALIDKIREGGAYANVHTRQKPGGEVRGQIRASGGMMMK